MAESKRLDRDSKGRFKKGNIANPKGRPKGTRDAIKETFLEDFYGAWKKHGKEALNRAAEQDPIAFARIAASLIPKQAEIKHTLIAEIEQLTDDQLDERIKRLAGEGAALSAHEGAGKPH